ncbi:hypothetical protein V8C37DRAFT_384328 [Trichoderma ceciliae]
MASFADSTHHMYPKFARQRHAVGMSMMASWWLLGLLFCLATRRIQCLDRLEPLRLFVPHPHIRSMDAVCTYSGLGSRTRPPGAAFPSSFAADLVFSQHYGVHAHPFCSRLSRRILPNNLLIAFLVISVLQ